MIPGEVITKDGDIILNENRLTTTVTVANQSDRPIQIGSHYHFFEVNRDLAFDREATYGYRLDIPAGTAVRFEPGETQVVQLVTFGGDRIIHGLNGLTEGSLAAERDNALQRAKDAGFIK